MSDMNNNQAESELKNIYYDVHVNEQEYMIKYGKIAAAVNESDVYLSDYEKLAAAIEIWLLPEDNTCFKSSITRSVILLNCFGVLINILVLIN